MSDTYIFKRVEKKYRINKEQKDALLALIEDNLSADEHGKSTVCSIYLDTPDSLLIRNSISAKAYKEKLRLRSYGTPTDGDRVFLEIKKKYKGTVYKRRVALSLAEAQRYIETGIKPFDSQIFREIDYAMKFYRMPRPAILIACEREAFFDKNDQSLRVTIDSNIRYRTSALSLSCGSDGTAILPHEEMILEIKSGGAMPLWLAHALDACCIYPSSFSKYATAYMRELTNKGGLKNACNI